MTQAEGVAFKLILAAYKIYLSGYGCVYQESRTATQRSLGTAYPRARLADDASRLKDLSSAIDAFWWE